MLPTIFVSLARFLFITLRITPSGSFPKPLSAQDEYDALIKCANGDEKAKNLLIEHNLRLVAHVVNNT